MRLLILSQYFWPEEFRVNELAVELAKRGHDVCVLTGWPNYAHDGIYPQFRADPNAFANLDGVEIVRVPLWPRAPNNMAMAANYASFAVMASTWGAWKLRGRSFDAILAYQMSPGTIGLPAVVLRWLKRARLFFWVHDLWPETLEAIGAIRSQRLLRAVERAMRWVYARTDHILVQSEAFAPRLRSRVPAHVPVSYVPNWAQPVEETTRVEDSASAFDVYFLGNIGDAQDFPAVVDAIARLAHLSDLHWHLVGDGRRVDWIRQQLAERNLQHRVTLPGFFPAQDMPSFYQKADALLVSLKKERVFELTVPSKVQTYLAAGVPILGMLDGEGARIIEEAGAGLTCTAGDSAGLARIVETMMNMPKEERQQMGRAGKAYGEREFDFTLIVDRLETLMQGDPR